MRVISLTRCYSTYFEVFTVWQFTNLLLGDQCYLLYVSLVVDKISAFLGHFFSGPLGRFYLLIFVFFFQLYHLLTSRFLLFGILEVFCSFQCCLVVVQFILYSLLHRQYYGTTFVGFWDYNIFSFT